MMSRSREAEKIWGIQTVWGPKEAMKKLEVLWVIWAWSCMKRLQVMRCVGRIWHITLSKSVPISGKRA